MVMDDQLDAFGLEKVIRSIVSEDISVLRLASPELEDDASYLGNHAIIYYTGGTVKVRTDDGGVQTEISLGGGAGKDMIEIQVFS